MIFRQIERELDRYDEMHEVKTQLPTMHQNITATKKASVSVSTTNIEIACSEKKS